MAATVWSKERAVCPMQLPELFALWDHKGKLESKNHSYVNPHAASVAMDYLTTQKILRAFSHLMDAMLGPADNEFTQLTRCEAGLLKVFPAGISCRG